MAARLLGVVALGVLVAVLAGCGGDSSTTTVTVTEAVTTTSTTTEASPATTAIVIELQQVMTDLGYYEGPIDGVYGEGTVEGVKAMQTDLGVTADGIYGAETHNALKGKGDAIVASIQTALATYGYYDGTIDGEYGQATTDAVKALQADLGVTQDGKFGPETATAFDEAGASGDV